MECEEPGHNESGASIRYQRGTASATWASAGIMGWSYAYDSDAPQRRESVLPYRALGEAPLAASPPSWGYAYNLRGEVTGAVRGDADAAAVAGQDWGYFYDAIGNRSSSTRAGRAVIYEPNSLNQYELLQHPGEVEVSGFTAPGVARVEVNGQPAAGRPAGNGEPEGFTQWLTVANSAKAVWLDVGVKATRPGEPPENTPLEMLRQGRLWVPRAQTAPEHDADGNLLFDGRWRYAWDAENRLVSMETDSEVGLRILAYRLSSRVSSFRVSLGNAATSNFGGPHSEAQICSKRGGRQMGGVAASSS